MAALGKILEPGERVLARTPPRWAVWTIVLTILTMPAMTSALFWFSDEERLREAAWFIYFFAGLAAFNLLTLVPVLRWRIVATDRRILVRHGLLRRELEQIDRDSIEHVRQDGFSIRIEGGGRVIETACHPLTAGRLLAVIDPARAAQAEHSGAPGGLPGPDEPVLLRPKSQLPVMLIAAFLAMAPLATVQYVFKDTAVTGEPLAWVSILGLPGFFLLASVVLITAVARSQKQWLITGRRIVTIQGVFRRRIEEMRLDWITGSDFDGVTLTIRDENHALDVPLGEVRAAELHRVLGRWFPWRGAPAAPAKALLRHGETLLLRRPRKWVAAAGFAAPVLILGGTVAWIYFLSGGEIELRRLAPVLMSWIPLLVLLPRMLRESAWSLMVTDRRVLLRRRHDHGRYDALALDEIEDNEVSARDTGRVTLRGQGRTFEIPAGSTKAAERIREAIETAKGAGRWRA